jgi:hypothetical protein
MFLSKGIFYLFRFKQIFLFFWGGGYFNFFRTILKQNEANIFKKNQILMKQIFASMRILREFSLGNEYLLQHAFVLH